MITYQDYISYIKDGILKPRVKIEWLRPDDTVYGNFVADVLSGTLTINKQNGTRRSVDITMQNIDGMYVPNEYSNIWVRKKFKLWLGFEINNEDYFIEQGVFVVKDPEVTSNFSDKSIKLTGLDKFSLFDGQLGGELDAIYEIPSGSNLYNVIKSLLIAFGDTTPPILDNGFMNVPISYTLRKDFGNNVGEIITDLAGLVSANVYYNENGRLIFEKDINDTTKGSLWDFSTDEFAYMGAIVTYKYSEIFNAVTVTGTNVDGTALSGSATNNNLSSDTCVQLIGKRTKPITDDLINSVDNATTRAKYELKKLIAMQNSVSLKSIPMYHLDVDNVITLTDNSLKLNKERFLLQTINIPLGTSGQQITLTCVKADDLGFITYNGIA